MKKVWRKFKKLRAMTKMLKSCGRGRMGQTANNAFCRSMMGVSSIVPTQGADLRVL